MAKAKTQGAGPATKGLEVVARRDRFFRGGLEFTSEPRVVPLDSITEEQAARIRAEGEPGGQLVVTEVDIQAGAA